MSPPQPDGRLSVAALVQASMAGREEEGIRSGAKIPWYIIDPTGAVIRAQRRAEASQLMLKKIQNLSSEEKEKAAALQLEKKTEERRRSLEQARKKAEAEKRLQAAAAELQKRKEADKVREREAADKPRPWYVPSPILVQHVPTLYPKWDMVTAAALIFTAIGTPIEVGFLAPPQSWGEPMNVINRMIDLIFILDMLSQFFTMQKLETVKLSSSDVEWVMDLKIIAKKYLQGWFLIDAGSIIPSVFDILPLMGVGTPSGNLKTLRIVRAFRLFKLVRLYRASRLTKRLKENISWPSLYTTLFSLGFKVVMTVHYFACTLAIMTTFADSPLDTWLATYGFCKPDGLNPSNGERRAECASPGLIYFTALKWGLGLLVGQGLSVTPSTGPFPSYYSEFNIHETDMTIGEQAMMYVQARPNAQELPRLKMYCSTDGSP